LQRETRDLERNISGCRDDLHVAEREHGNVSRQIQNIQFKHDKDTQANRWTLIRNLQTQQLEISPKFVFVGNN